MQDTFDKGSVLIIEVVYKKNDPFVAEVLFDPSVVPTVTVTDREGTVKVSAQNMTKHVVGKYYYKLQTTTAWVAGQYIVQANATDATDDDVTIEPEAFLLV